jgi:sugar lactone lactonase YvrE
VRMNDGKCDPQGRFWAGSMAFSGAPGRGALYRLDPDLTVTRVLDRCTISNGLDWSDDGGRLYYIDSGVPGVDVFDFDGATGTIANRRRVVDVPNDEDAPAGATAPDGMTIDAEGFLWVAVWGGGEVRRFTTTGELDAVVEMPVACPTSVAFGGDDLADLYITSMTPDRTAKDGRTPVDVWDPKPSEGALFRCRPGVAGRPARTFAG